MNWKCLVFGIIALAGPIGTTPSCADELFLAGGNSGPTSDYAFTGAVIPLPGAQLGHGLAARIWGDYLDYTYRTGNRKITATGFGGALGGVYQFSGAWGWANLSPGLTYRNTRLSASDPNNEEAGAHTYFNGEVDGAYNLSSAWRVRGLASYTPQTKDYFVQTGIDRSVLEWLRLGIGPTFQGGHNYSEVSGGVTAYIRVMDGLEIAPSVGVSHSDSGETGPYGAITFVIVGHL